MKVCKSLPLNKLYRLTAVLISSLFTSSAYAERTLAELVVMIPQLLFLWVYLGILRYGWMLVGALVIAWCLHWSMRYFRKHHPDPDSDKLLETLGALALHKLVTSLGIVALCWVLLAHIWMGEEKLTSLKAYMAQEESLQKAQPAVPPPVFSLANPFESAWPNQSGYLEGVPVLARGGNSTLLISNSEAGPSVYIKLCHYGEQPCRGMRHAYVESRRHFRMDDIAPGEYELRYQTVRPQGAAARSSKIVLVDGLSYTEKTITILGRLDIPDSGGTMFTKMDASNF